jgi:HAE1 family hydrophobic/amphiphilic exporter-1
MSLVDFSLRRRVTVGMCVVAMVIFGLVAFARLRISLLPELTYPTVTIETRFDGAAPAEVEQLLTRPIEERVGVVSGARRITSVSKPGLSQVTVEFPWKRDMDFAVIDVHEKLDRVRLPEGAERPVLLRFDPAADPIIRLFLSGAEDAYRLRELAEETVEKDLESTDGVAAIEVHGGFQEEIEVEVDERRLAALGLTMAEVVDRLGRTNVDQAGGSLFEREARYLVRTRNRLQSTAAIGDVIVARRDGRNVTVADVAEVRRGHGDRRTVSRLDGVEAVEIAIYKEGDANTTTVAESIEHRLQAVRARLPPGVELTVTADQSRFIRASVSEVLQSAAIGGAFAVLVLLLFLRDLRSTLIIAAAIPISVVATFFAMYETGTTLNVMSLGGLALGVGMLVDNAIVVLEAIFKHRERGASRLEAARQGASEVGSAVVASTLTTVAVFLPVVFLDGIAAQLFRDMAVTVCSSLLASLIVSLTFIPMLSALGGGTPSSGAATESAPPVGAIRRAGFEVVTAPLFVLRVGIDLMVRGGARLFRPVAQAFDSGLARMVQRYPAWLRFALRRPGTVLGIAGMGLTAALVQVPRLGLDLVPSLHQSEFGVRVDLSDGTPLKTTDRVLTQVAAALADDPRVERVATVGGEGAQGGRGGGTDGENVGFVSLQLAPGTEASDGAELVARVREHATDHGAVRTEVQRSTVFSLRQPIEVELAGENLDALREQGERIRARLVAIEGLTEVRSSAEYGAPEVQVRFDRGRVAALGLAIGDVAEVARTKLAGQVATRFERARREIDVRVRAIDREEGSLEDVREMIVAQRDGAPIRLGSIADVVVTTGPSEIRRVGQRRAAIITADVIGRDMGAVTAEIESLILEMESDSSFPVGLDARLVGQSQEMERALDSMLMAMALAGFLVYVVMASLFESLIHPFVVILTLPLGLVGVVGALAITGTSVSVVSMIGMVMLAGIVVNNAIVLVDSINQRRLETPRVLDAIVLGGRERLRPILITTATTVLGLLPMALATGAGAELRQALAVAVIGGITVATALTLVVIPTVYWIVARSSDVGPATGADPGVDP